MAKYKLTNRGSFITVQHKGETVNLCAGEILDTDDTELAAELSRWKYVELQGELPLEFEEKEPFTLIPPPVDLQDLSKKELASIAENMGITVKSKMNKNKLREAIVNAREQSSLKHEM